MAHLPAFAGTVQTTEGAVFNGSIRIHDQSILVQSPTNDPIQVPLTAAVLIRFEENQSHTVGTPDAPALSAPDSSAQQAVVLIPTHPERPSDPPPWMLASVGNSNPPPQAHYTNNTLGLACAPGTLPQSLDTFGAVLRTVSGDFTLTARLRQFDPPGPSSPPPLAGLVLQQDAQPGSPRAAYLVDTQATLHRITRSRSHTDPVASQNHLALPLWLRLIRDGASIRFHTSTDGRYWELDDLLGMRLTDQAQVGFAACSSDPNQLATAIFDQIRLTLGPPPMADPVPGILLVNGTFLAQDLADPKSLSYTSSEASVPRTAQEPPLTFPARHLARISYAPLTEEDAQRHRHRTGVLLKNGDFAEGRVHAIRNGRITMESVLLGRQSHAASTEAACVFFRPPVEGAAGYRVITKDHSILRVRSLRGEGDWLHLEEPLLGWVTVLQSNLVQVLTPATFDPSSGSR